MHQNKLMHMLQWRYAEGYVDDFAKIASLTQFSITGHFSVLGPTLD